MSQERKQRVKKNTRVARARRGEEKTPSAGARIGEFFFTPTTGEGC